MRDEKLCQEINGNLPTGWHHFEPLDDGQMVHSYLIRGSFGVLGKSGCWRVVHDDDGLPVGLGAFPVLEYAIRHAEELQKEEDDQR